MRNITFAVITIILILGFDVFGIIPKRGDTLVFGTSKDAAGLDPSYESEKSSFAICDNIFEALVFYADESTTIEPGLATSWEISADGKVYTFHLRRGVTFHDGTPFNANSVVFSIGRMMKDKNVRFFGKGYKIPPQKQSSVYWVSMGMDETIERIEASDQFTVRFQLKRISAPFLANLGMDFTDIISPSAFLKNPDTFSKNPVGTGPFKFLKWIKEERIILEKNTSYWDKSGGPYLDRLVFKVIPENSHRYFELKSGSIHIYESPTAFDIIEMKKSTRFQVSHQPGMDLGYIGFNHTKEPWKSNIHLRRAIAHAVNRKVIVNAVYGGMAEVAKNPMPPTIWGYNNHIGGYEYSPKLAKIELKKAGYPGGRGLEEITLWAMPVPRPYNPEGLKFGIAMISDLLKIGIRARIVSYDWDTYLRRQREHHKEMDLFQLGWIGDNGDPDNFLALLFDGIASPSIRNQWRDERYHALMVNGRKTIDQSLRSAIYKKALKLLYENVVAIPVSHSMVTLPMSKSVKNFKLHPTGSYRMKNVWLN